MDRRSAHILQACVLAAAATVVPLSSVGAANLNATPNITLDGSWDSNVLNAPRNEVSDYLVRAVPRLTLSLQTRTATVSLSGGFEAERYAEREELNRTSATKNIDLTTTDPIQITPRFSLRPSARFVESVDAVRRIALSETTIPGLPPSESLVTARTTVREYSGSLQFRYSLTSNVDLEFGGGGLRRQYPDHPPGVFGARTYSGDLGLRYRVTPRTSTGIFGHTSHDSYDGRPSSRTYTAGFSGNYAISERAGVDGRVGASLLRESIGIGGESRDEWSPYGRFSLTYASRGFRATFAGSYELAGGGSLGRTTKRSNASVTFTDRLTPLWAWDLSGSVQSNRSTDDPVTEDFVTGEGSGGIRYVAAQWASLHLSGHLFRQRSRGLVGDDISRQSVLLGITLSNTYNVF